MSTTTAETLRASSTDELNDKLREAKEELFNLRFQAATGQLENHGRLTAVRKEIARIYTIPSRVLRNGRSRELAKSFALLMR